MASKGGEGGHRPPALRETDYSLPRDPPSSPPGTRAGTLYRDSDKVTTEASTALPEPGGAGSLSHNEV